MWISILGIEYAHQRNKKVYVTISLLPHNNDFVKLEEYLLKLDEAKVDAVILCEPGALEIVKKVIPNMEIHMGTQANIYNYETANFWYEQGIKRVIKILSHKPFYFFDVHIQYLILNLP